jgi:hypothetical protein
LHNAVLHFNPDRLAAIKTWCIDPDRFPRY